jgi:hypothetical protein
MKSNLVAKEMKRRKLLEIRERKNRIMHKIPEIMR